MINKIIILVVVLAAIIGCQAQLTDTPKREQPKTLKEAPKQTTIVVNDEQKNDRNPQNIAVKQSTNVSPSSPDTKSAKQAIESKVKAVTNPSLGTQTSNNQLKETRQGLFPSEKQDKGIFRGDLDGEEGFKSFIQTVQKAKTEMQTGAFNSFQEKATQENEAIAVEQQKQKEWEDINSKNLNPWITEELESVNVMVEEGIVTQTFQVALETGNSFNFRWNPPKSQAMHIKMMVFEIIDDGGLLIMHDNEQDQFVDVQYREQGRSTYNKLGKVYIERTFVFNFDTDYKYFRLTNNVGKRVMLIVDLQRLQEVIKVSEAVHNDNFTTIVKKLTTIHNEVVSGEKLREHSYKYQWGFLDNQYSHDSRLLALTGLQLLVMIAAALVQVYFIKNLLDNRAVV